MGCHGRVAGIASHERVIPSRGQLVTVEATEYPMYLSSIQQDAVVNNVNTTVTFLPKFS